MGFTAPPVPRPIAVLHDVEVVVSVSGPMPIVAEAYLDRLVDANTLPWSERDVPVPGGTGTQAVESCCTLIPRPAPARCSPDNPEVW